jgi:ABC-2 type transport system ATP-binding protein
MKDNIAQTKDIAVDIHDVSKFFLLPHEKNKSIKSLFINLFKTNSNKSTTEKQKVLHGINLSIDEGDFFGIVGRNGSGKSTLLKIIAGIYQPSEGSVNVKGRVVPFIELGVGFNGELSARDNVYLNGALLGFSREQIEKRYADIVAFAELGKFMDQNLKNFSSGMQVRLAFSIATRLAESDILLIDEVLAVGDAKFQRKCFDYFSSLKKQKKTVIFVTHDMNAVRQYCDQAMLIEASKQVLVGSPEEVATEYTKLFQNTHSVESGEPDSTRRYGSGKLKISSIKTNKPTYVAKGEAIEITCAVKAHEKVENIIFGISIMNEAGQRLLGTNTNLLKMGPATLAKNEKKQFTWMIPNVLNEGNYDICPAVVLTNGEVCDAWDGATTISVYDNTSTAFPVNPQILFTEENVTKKKA